MKQIVLMLLAFAIGWPLTVAAAPVRAPGIRPGELIVKFAPEIVLSADAQAHGPEAVRIDAQLRHIGARQAQALGFSSQTYRVSFSPSVDARWAAAQVAAAPGVRYAVPNYMRTALREPNDPMLPQQWSLRNIRAAEAWEITTGGAITIAILDTGVSPNHPDLHNRLLPGYDFFNGDDDSSDDEGHGTHTAGIVAAESDNGSGVAGICWTCTILPVKVLSRRGQGDDATIAQGIRYAVDQGAQIVSMSLGGPDDSPVLRDAVQYAADHNVLIVAASGNGQANGNLPNYPAAYPSVLSVTATNNADAVASFSTTGSFVDIAAPGVDVWSTLWNSSLGDTYGVASGTSTAAPHVAGVAALVRTLRPDLLAAQVAEILEASVDDIDAPGKDAESGYGRLNAVRAVELARDPNVLNRSRIQGVVRGAPAAHVTLTLSTGQQTRPAADGTYGFDNLPTGVYSVRVRWPNGEIAEQQTWLSGTQLSVATLDFAFNAALASGAPFAPAPSPNDPNDLYFSATQHTLREPFKTFWQTNGGLPIFGYPISEAFVERAEDGREYTVQYFERHRLEHHPENAPPYNILLTRIGDAVLGQQGRDWTTFAVSPPAPACRYFPNTRHNVCGAFLRYWQAGGLEFDGQAGSSSAESLALFGQPLSEAQVEVLEDGQTYIVQWFERARFEWHGDQGVLLGLLGNTLVANRG